MSRGLRQVALPLGLHRGVCASLLALFAVGSCQVVVASAQAAVPAGQPLVALLQSHVARTRPDAGAHRIQSVAARRPLTRRRTVLPVLGNATDGAGKPWLQVLLPGRPSGHTGWISADHTRRTSTAWHIAIKLSTRRVTVYYDGRVIRVLKAVVGKPSTPTPVGRFFVEEGVALSSQDAGGPYAMATSARSAVLQEFKGGPGQIALHGRKGLAGSLGTAASHGCIRLTTRAITWLARRIGSGVPLTVEH